MRLKKILAPALLVILSIALLGQLAHALAKRSGDYDLFDSIIDVRHVLLDRFVDEKKLDAERMQRAMIDAMIETLDDPYTQFIPFDNTAEFEKHLRGTYVGIGCEVNIVDNYLTIVTPMDGSPALHAGVMAGDIVLEIEGESTFELPISECIDRLTGEPNTPVTIRVRHLDETEEDIEIIRQQIVTRTVKGLLRAGEAWSYCVNDELGLSYVRVSQFNESTTDELQSTLEQLQAQGLNGLILDLRDDPGGALPAALQVSDLFLDEGTIVSVKPRRGQSKSFSAKRLGTLPDFPLLILVNGQSASASEIVAGCLQENGRAKVLGTRTYGKGSVQEIRELEFNRGTIKYTTAHYYLPSGRNLNRSSDSEVWGVDPDPGMVVRVSDEDYVEMFKARRLFEIIRDPDPDALKCADAQWIRENLKDEQLAVAVETISKRVSDGSWPRVSEDEATDVAFGQELSRARKARTRLMRSLEEVDNKIAELEGIASAAGTPPLLPPDVDLLEGMLTVHDKHGNLIGNYRIAGGDVQVTLNHLPLTPLADIDK